MPNGKFLERGSLPQATQVGLASPLRDDYSSWMLIAPSAWAEVPQALAAAPDTLGLAHVRLGMQEAEVVAVAPSLYALDLGARTSVDLRTKWVLAGSVKLRDGCTYRAEVGGGEGGATDISLRSLSADLARCSHSMEQQFGALLGAPRVQVNPPPAVPSTYYVWDGRFPSTLQVSHFYGGPHLTWLSITLIDKRASPSVVR